MGARPSSPPSQAIQRCALKPQQQAQRRQKGCSLIESGSRSTSTTKRPLTWPVVSIQHRKSLEKARMVSHTEDTPDRRCVFHSPTPDVALPDERRIRTLDCVLCV
jgi:hypothetical protein